MPSEEAATYTAKTDVPAALKDLVKVVGKQQRHRTKLKKPPGKKEASWEDEKFWMVLLKGGGNPTFKHPTLASAYEEAVRLSKATLREAAVLEVIGRTSAPKPD